MAKSPEAFRTISEVADWLGIQAHVLRFWESKFSQVKPIKRAGGRRYYRPTDMLLLGGIKKLLHDDGLTIKGVQKLLREEGMSHVADLSQPLDDGTLDQLDDMPDTLPETPEEERGVVLDFASPAEEAPTAPDEAEPPDEQEEPAPVDAMLEDTPAAATEELPEAVDPEPEPLAAEEFEEDPVEAAVETATEDAAESEPRDTVETATEDAVESAIEDAEPATGEPPAEPLSFRRHSPAPTDAPAPEAPAEDPEQKVVAELPAFLRKPLDTTPRPPAPEEPAAQEEYADADAPEEAAEASEAPEAPKPRVIDLPPFTPEADFEADPATLSAAYRLDSLPGDRARDIAPLLERLTTLRDAMNAQRRTPAPPSR